VRQIWKEGVNLWMSDRSLGVSPPPYESLNIAFHVGDKEENVKRNLALALQGAGMEKKRLFYLQQVHGTKIWEVDTSISGFPKEGDGLMTNDPNVVLLCMVADCNPIALYDPKTRALALLHAGRAGVYKKILTQAIHQMKNRYGSEALDLRVYVGPSIRGCCYEVGESIAREFEGDSSLSMAVKRREERFYLHLIAPLLEELKVLGVSEERILVDEHCSACDERFFSYRREGITGRMGLFGSLEA